MAWRLRAQGTQMQARGRVKTVVRAMKTTLHQPFKLPSQFCPCTPTE